MHNFSGHIIDFHTHAFPDGLAPRAMAGLSKTAQPFGYGPHTDGTVAGLIASMDAGGVARSVVCNIATNASQMRKVNDFAMETARRAGDRLIPLGSLHPAATEDELTAEVDRLCAAGVPGIKLHPDYVRVEFDHPAFDPILSRCAERGLFVVIHAGFDPVSPDKIHASPAHILRVLDRYPTLTLIAAHTGGFGCEEEVLAKLCGRNVYLDTSLLAVRAARNPLWGERCAAILRAHRKDRILFATDTPWSTPAEELAFLSTVGLSNQDLQAVLHGNAERLLGR